MSERLQILFTQTSYPPAIGGAQAYLHQHAKRLAARHQVEVVSFWRCNRTDWLWGTTVRSPGGRPYGIDGVPVTPIVFSWAERWSLLPWVLAYYLWQGKAIERIAQRIQTHLEKMGLEPDVVHHGRVGREPLAFASLALARACGVPFVLTPFHHQRWGSLLHRHYHRLYREADAILALTEAERETLIGLGVGEERIVVTGVGPSLSDRYDGDAFLRRYNLRGPIVLFLGQKFAYKGIVPLLRAAQLVWEEQAEAKFVFLGPRTSYSRRIFAGIDDRRVLELGAVSDEEKTSALAACDLLCVPSSQESFGSVFVEAWQMGKPVIGGDSPAVSGVIDHGVDGFVAPIEPSALAKQILLLLDAPERRKAMGVAGQRKVAQQFDWDRLTGRLEALYCSLLGGSKVRWN